MIDRIADTLVLTFTGGVSLDLWKRTGVLAREWALYQSMGRHYGRILLVTYGGATDRDIALNLTAGGARVRVVCNDRGMGRDEFATASAEEVADTLRGASGVVVKSNQLDGAEAAERIARRLRADGLRVGLVVRGGYHWSVFVARREGAQTAAAKNASTLEGAVCRGADVVVGTTRTMVDELTWQHGLTRESSRVIPNYVVERQPTNGARAPGLVLCAGRMEAQKRFELLIDAMGLVARQAPGARLVIVGDGELEASLRRRAADSGAAVEFAGRLAHEDLLERMSRCWMYAQVSEYEGHPKTVIEAQMSGCATLVTDSPGLREVVRNEENGLLVDEDVASIASGIVRLLGDASLRDRLGSAAAERARDVYALERVLPLEIAAHKDALARGAARAESGGAVAPVRWEPDLLQAPVQAAVGEWARSLQGFTRRLPARRRAEFLMALDEPLYQMQGRSAVDANGGLHPKHHLMRYHDFFVERIGPGERVLDLGSGVGAVACSVAERSGAVVMGMDIDPANVANAQQRAINAGLVDRTSFVCGDITTHRADGLFDVLILSNVLEHVRNRAALLRMWMEWYRPSRILMRVPAFDRDWRTPWKRELGLEWRLDDTHEIEYTVESLASEVGAAGLAISEQVANWGEYWIEARDASCVEARA